MGQTVRFQEILRKLAIMDESVVQEQAGRQVIDPSLYLGMLAHRLGRPQEALRYLSEANRIDPNCPFVMWQMGVSLVASGGDSGLAMRALQRALAIYDNRTAEQNAVKRGGSRLAVCAPRKTDNVHLNILTLGAILRYGGDAAHHRSPQSSRRTLPATTRSHWWTNQRSST